MRRLTAPISAPAALSGLWGQFVLNGSKPDLAPWGARAWDLARYFTILTNLMVAGVMAAEATGRRTGPVWLGTITLNIAMVGLVYQLLLRPEVPLTGWNWVTDFLMHALVPVAMVLWWGGFGPRRLPVRAVLPWLLWPVAYCVYALIRGGFEGRYPYFFLDIGRFGGMQIAINIAGLVVVFAAFGLILWAAARKLPAR